MGDLISGLTGPLKVKIGLVIAALLLGAFGIYYWQNQQRDAELKETKTELTTVKVVKQVNEDAADTFKTGVAINENTRMETKAAVAVIEKKIYVADTEARAREAAIRQQYAELQSKTTDEVQRAALVTEQQEKVSAVRIAEMWSLFCQGEPDNPRCTMVQASNPGS